MAFPDHLLFPIPSELYMYTLLLEIQPHRAFRLADSHG